MGTLCLRATSASVSEVARRVVDLAGELGLGRDGTYRLRLAAEEIAMNIVTHGFGEGPRIEHPTFAVEWGADRRRVWLCFSDDARPFDPTTVPPPDNLDDPLEDRPIGGLGIHLVRTSLDEFRYERAGGRNRVTLGLRRPPAQEGDHDAGHHPAGR